MSGEKITKAQFVEEMTATFFDVTDYDDCVNWWRSFIDSYIDSGIIPKSATRWNNPFLKTLKDKLNACLSNIYKSNIKGEVKYENFCLWNTTKRNVQQLNN